MRRVYTLRRLFRDGVRGQADLDEAIRHGDAPTRRVATVAAFWVKINNDWIFNLSGLLAYNFLFAIFPILILVLAITGFVLSNHCSGHRNPGHRQHRAGAPSRDWLSRRRELSARGSRRARAGCWSWVS